MKISQNSLKERSERAFSIIIVKMCSIYYYWGHTVCSIVEKNVGMNGNSCQFLELAVAWTCQSQLSNWMQRDLLNLSMLDAGYVHKTNIHHVYGLLFNLTINNSFINNNLHKNIFSIIIPSVKKQIFFLYS